MKNLLLILLVGVLIGCDTPPASTTSQITTPPVEDRIFSAKDFNGSWHGIAKVINKAGRFDCNQHLTIEVDNDGGVTGKIGWSILPKKSETDDNQKFGNNSSGEKVDKHTEDIIGLLNTEDGTLTMVEQFESGTLKGKMRSDGTLELLRTQPGEFHVVTHAILKHEQKD
ncbi:MAG: hypothetical protein P8L78_12330 [Mariniblastus sp.]|nr:hypothetical protein [Mariniblastus sp.]